MAWSIHTDIFTVDYNRYGGPILVDPTLTSNEGYIMVIAAKTNAVRYAAVFFIAAGM